MNTTMNEIRSAAGNRREVDKNGNNKIQRYDWKANGAPGELKLLHKDLLRVNLIYQREATLNKVHDIARNWSWVGCGAIVVTYRNGTVWVIDGQHRVLAAQSRSDITVLPCVVFELPDVESEAQGFLDLNGGRKPVTAIAKQKAMVAAGDEVAIFVEEKIAEAGLYISKSSTVPGSITAIAWCQKRAREDRESFSLVLFLSADISRQDKVPVRERLLDGLLYLHNRMSGGLTEKRLFKRIKEKGADALFAAANKASAYYGTGGAKVWAEGILSELNRGLVHKFELAPL